MIGIRSNPPARGVCFFQQTPSLGKREEEVVSFDVVWLIAWKETYMRRIIDLTNFLLQRTSRDLSR